MAKFKLKPKPTLYNSNLNPSQGLVFSLGLLKASCICPQVAIQVFSKLLAEEQQNTVLDCQKCKFASPLRPLNNSKGFL